MAKKIQDGNQIVTNVDSNDNLTFSIKSSFIDSTPTTNSTNLVTSGGVKSAIDTVTAATNQNTINIGNNTTTINSHTTSISNLTGRMTTAEEDIDNLSDDISDMISQVSSLSNAVPSQEAVNFTKNSTYIGNAPSTIGYAYYNSSSMTGIVNLNFQFEVTTEVPAHTAIFTDTNLVWPPISSPAFRIYELGSQNSYTAYLNSNGELCNYDILPEGDYFISGLYNLGNESNSTAAT